MVQRVEGHQRQLQRVLRWIAELRKLSRPVRPGEAPQLRSRGSRCCAIWARATTPTWASEPARHTRTLAIATRSPAHVAHQLGVHVTTSCAQLAHATVEGLHLWCQRGTPPRHTGAHHDHRSPHHRVHEERLSTRSQPLGTRSWTPGWVACTCRSGATLSCTRRPAGRAWRSAGACAPTAALCLRTARWRSRTHRRPAGRRGAVPRGAGDPGGRLLSDPRPATCALQLQLRGAVRLELLGATCAPGGHHARHARQRGAAAPRPATTAHRPGAVAGAGEDLPQRGPRCQQLSVAQRPAEPWQPGRLPGHRARPQRAALGCQLPAGAVAPWAGVAPCAQVEPAQAIGAWDSRHVAAWRRWCMAPILFWSAARARDLT